MLIKWLLHQVHLHRCLWFPFYHRSPRTCLYTTLIHTKNSLKIVYLHRLIFILRDYNDSLMSYCEITCCDWLKGRLEKGYLYEVALEMKAKVNMHIAPGRNQRCLLTKALQSSYFVYPPKSYGQDSFLLLSKSLTSKNFFCLPKLYE